MRLARAMGVVPFQKTSLTQKQEVVGLLQGNCNEDSTPRILPNHCQNSNRVISLAHGNDLRESGI